MMTIESEHLFEENENCLSRIDVYDMSLECNACMKSSEEVFDYLEVNKVGGLDTWKADYVSLTNYIEKYCLKHHYLDTEGSVRITERALRRTKIKPISNLIGRRNRQTTALTFIYSDRLQKYIINSFIIQNSLSKGATYHN